MTSEQLLGIGTLLGTLLWTIYRLWKKANDAQQQSQTTQDDHIILKELVDKLQIDNARMEGRLAEQRVIYQTSIDSLRKEVASLQQLVRVKEEREQKLVQALRAEQQKSIRQAEEIQGLRKRITELEEQLGFMMKLKAAND